MNDDLGRRVGRDAEASRATAAALTVDRSRADADTEAGTDGQAADHAEMVELWLTSSEPVRVKPPGPVTAYVALAKVTPGTGTSESRTEPTASRWSRAVSRCPRRRS